MTREGSKIMSIISVAGPQVKNSSQPSEINLVHLDFYADYLREKDPKSDYGAGESVTYNQWAEIDESRWTLDRSLSHTRY